MSLPAVPRNLRHCSSVQRIAPWAAFLALAAGCSRTPPPLSPPPRATAGVEVSPAEVSLQAGDATQLSAQANDASGQPIGGAQFRYTPADPKVLRVSDRGLLTALGRAIGPTEVIVASGRAEQRVPVVVQPGPPQRIEKLGGDDQTLHAGQTAAPLSARILDAWGNPIPKLAMTIEAASTALASSEKESDANGTVRIDVPAVTLAGTVIIAVHPEGSATPAETFTLHVAPAAPVHLSLEPNAPEAAPSAESSRGVKVRVSDAYENPVSGVAVRARMTKSDKSPALAHTDDTGIAFIPVPRTLKVRRLTLDVELVDSPSTRASFVVRNPSL